MPPIGFDQSGDLMLVNVCTCALVYLCSCDQYAFNTLCVPCVLSLFRIETLLTETKRLPPTVAEAIRLGMPTDLP